MTAARNRRAEASGDLEFKTSDGNDIGVDVTVIYRTGAGSRQRTCSRRSRGTTRASRRASCVPSPARSSATCSTSSRARTSTRAKKFQAADKARTALDEALTPYGLRCDNVILGDHRFHDRYQAAINDRKVFDQQANTLQSAAENVQREWEAKLEATKGEVEKKIAQQNGLQQQKMIEADAYYISRRRRPRRSSPRRPRRRKASRR
jgi:regulator of protease activity HflC (stomatin/prohibitin superfamily)